MLRSRTPNDPSAPALCSMINSGVLSVVYVENFGRRLPEPESKKSCHSGYFFFAMFKSKTQEEWAYSGNILEVD